MNEYADRLSISKLIGVGPGWLGHDEEPLLVGALKKRPRSVILFDEIDKAHPDVCKTLLRLFEAGLIVDPRTNRNINAREAIYVMTSNAVAGDRPAIGFERAAPDRDVRDVFARTFSPEFVNRIDDVIVFGELDDAAIRAIAGLRLGELAGWVRDAHGVELEVDDSVADWVARRATRPQRGARDVARVIQTQVREPLGGALLEAGPGGVHALRVWAADDTLHFEPRRPAEGAAVQI